VDNINNILVIENLITGYEGKPILKDVDIKCSSGEICGIIGEEGCGKSTMVMALTQQIKSKGKINYNEIDLYGVPTNKMIYTGVDFCMQGGNILNSFTVEEHITLALRNTPKNEHGSVWKKIEVDFPKLISMKKQIAGRLSGGERIILTMACIMATDANLLILDEPTAGIAPETTQIIGDSLIRLKKNGKCILLFEHNYDFAFEISDYIVLLKDGVLSAKYGKTDFKKDGFVESKLYSTNNC